MLSLRDVAQDCLSLSTPLSVVHDVFGCWSGVGRTVSLKRRLELIKGHSLNINIILVGRENFTDADFEEIDYAVQLAREIYAEVDLCIRKIRWQQISVADAGGYITIDSEGEAHNLTDDRNGPNGDYLDVFVVRASTGGLLGVSPVRGPCSKDDKDWMTGSVVSLSGSYGKDQTGIVFAHEIGHYLGASRNDPGYHHTNASNFMFGSTVGSNTAITSSQGNEMRSHCYVKVVC